MADPNFVKCNSCGGIYKPVQDDGANYFHACPDGRVISGVVIDEATGKVITPAVFEKFTNRRDENIAGLDAAGAAIIKREGAGVQPVFDTAAITAAGFATEE